MRTGIVAFIIGNISLLYWPLNFGLMGPGFIKSDFKASGFIEPDTINLSLLNSGAESDAVFAETESIFLIVCLVFILILVLYKARQIFVSLSSFILPKSLKKLIFTIFSFWGGVLFTAFYITQMYPVLDLEQIEGKTIEVKGYLNSIPNQSKEKQSFEFFITALKLPVLQNKSDLNLSHQDKRLPLKQWDNSFTGKVRLSWYYTNNVLQNGQKWQLKIRLKKPNGLLNGDFDYEKWLYQNRILATGYVREGYILNTSDQSFFSTFFKVHIVNLRQKVASQIDIVLADYPYKGLVKALAIGIRHDIEPEQWQSFLRTGTNHLIAISGLHIGLMSSFIWIIVFALWRSISILNLRCPATYIASVAALIAAIMYAALAGFAIPTQRALIMLCVVFMAIMFKREFQPSYILLLAFLSVIVFDPLSPLSPGFWLSFGAVAIILLIVSARLSIQTDKKDKFLQFGWLQFAIFIGLLPPLLILFHQFSLISPIANLFAVPLMSLIIVPLTLFATALLFIFAPLGLFVFKLLQWPIDALFDVLGSLSQWSNSLIYVAEAPWYVILMICIGSLWLLMPKGWHGRWLGVILFFPAFFVEAEKIPQGQVQLTVLDVGQGLAMILRTRHHILLYDTGDKYSEQFNMADKVIIPFMRLQGINKIDKLVVSHSDRDHAGSYAELIEQIPINEVLAGEPEKLNVKLSSNLDKNEINKLSFIFPVKQCISGQQWQWDDVQFRILSPQKPLLNKKRNNRSCVLQITTALKQTLLLTGDIEKKAEKQLVNEYPELKVDVLQVPHHGSRTSSSAFFLKHLEPKIALFSFGYRNRFHHPSEKVLSRYKKMQIKLYNTSNGAIDIKSNITNNSFSVKEYRVENRRLWHRDIKQL